MNEMKFSGEEWIGDIPTHWDLTPIGSVFKQRNEKVSDKEFEPLSVTMQGVVPQLESAAKSNDSDNRKKITIGDFVINSRSDRRGSFGVSDLEGSCSVINTVLMPMLPGDAHYYYYAFQTTLFPDEFYRWGNGIVADLWSTKWDNMRKILLPNPPEDERKAIAFFLDEKCKKIDALIDNERILIADLEKYKQSLISEHVIGAGYPDTVYKDDCFWMPQMPSHWDTAYSKRLFALRKEKAREEDEQLTASQKHGIIPQRLFVEKEGRQVVQVEKGEDILKHVEAGDFVISMRSFQGGLEYSETCGKISSAYVMLYPRDKSQIFNDYYKWLFKSDYYIKALQSTSDLVRDGQALRYSNFAKIYLPYPPYEEQQQIGEYLNNKCARIKTLTEQSEQLISMLLDYKKALIYEYVTGKKEVPN